MPFIQNSQGQSVIACFIDGKPVPLEDSDVFPVVQSSTGKTIHYAQNANPDIAKAAADAALRAFKTWKTTPLTKRQEIINRFADILVSSCFQEARTRKVNETSAPPFHGDIDVATAAEMARSVASSIPEACRGEISPTVELTTTNLIFKEPVGPVLIIPPWNAAVILPVRGICSALAAGCTVVMKASEMCPATHQIILEAFKEAGLPDGCLNQVQASRENAPGVVEALISHPAIRKIEFIGSAGVGKLVAQLAAKYLKPTLLELGDQSPVIVCEDADLQKAAQSVAFASNILHGQVCFSTERIYVHSSVLTPFKEALVEAFRGFPSAGNAVSAASFKSAKDLLDDAVAHGATFVVGSGEVAGPVSLQPCIITDVDPQSKIVNSEAFAPVAILYSVNDDDEAVELANAKSGGLSASVYTNNFERGLRLSRLLDFGQVQINENTMYFVPSTPVTGWKGSGWGSNGGRYGVEQFLQLKHVSLHNTKIVS